MKYFILLSGIFVTGLCGAQEKTSLLKQLKKTLQPTLNTHTFYNAVRNNDIEAITEHLKSDKAFPLKRLAETAAKKQHLESLAMLLSAGAPPPLYEVATQGRIDLGLLSLKYLSNLAEPPSELTKERLLKRLSKTGNQKLLHMYFDFGILKPEDVSHSLITSTKLGSKIHTALIEKRFMYGTGTCAICRTDFTKEETHKPEFLLKCGHMFHTACSNAWFEKRPTCPLCQKPVRPKKKNR